MNTGGKSFRFMLAKLTPCLLPTLQAPHYETQLGGHLSIPDLLLLTDVARHAMVSPVDRKILIKMCTNALADEHFLQKIHTISVIPRGTAAVGRVRGKIVAQLM